MEVIEYTKFINLFQPIEIGGELFLDNNADPSTIQYQAILETPDEYLWEKENDYLYSCDNSPNPKLISHFVVTQLSHQNDPVKIKLPKDFQNVELTKSYAEFVRESDMFNEDRHFTEETVSINLPIQNKLAEDIPLEIYFKNISKRWKKEIELAEEVIILSPYVTEPTAITVTKNTVGNKCKLFTLFSAELFVNQSSSVKTLIKLKKSGVNVYALKDLHAKVVFVSEKFASIGSQNLTHNGTKNKEATVIVKDKNKLVEIENSINEWIKDSYEITLEMLEEMKIAVKPFLNKYKVILEEAKKIDNEIETLIDEYGYDRKIKNLNDVIALKKQSYNYISCEIKRNSNKRGKYSLFPQSESDINVFYEKKHVIGWVLESGYRYICLHKNTGKIGWAKIVEGRITYFGSGVLDKSQFYIGEFYCSVSFSNINGSDFFTTSNLLVTIKIKYEELDFKVVFKTWFDIDGISVIDMRIIPHYQKEDPKNLFHWMNTHEEIISKKVKSAKRAKDFLEFIQANEQFFKNEIYKSLVSPFLYKNNKDLGDDAAKFFSSKFIELSLIEVQDHPFLIAEDQMILGKTYNHHFYS